MDKFAIVTGAGSGIGRAAALRLLSDGFHVALAGRTIDKLNEVAYASGATTRALPIATDIRQPSSVSALFAQTIDKFGRLDLVFNNAGIFPPSHRLENLPVELWQESLDTNVTGAFLCTQEAFRAMRKQDPQGGRIINNGSVSAHAPRPNAVAYTATKHAITGLTKQTSLDGRRYNIACGQIDIGNAHTDMTDKMAEGVTQADGNKRPEPTFDVQHVADAVAYMANLPLDANVQFMTVMATSMPYIGRG